MLSPKPETPSEFSRRLFVHFGEWRGCFCFHQTTFGSTPHFDQICNSMTAFPATVKSIFDPEVLLGTGRAWLGRINIWQRWHHSVLCTKVSNKL